MRTSRVARAITIGVSVLVVLAANLQQSPQDWLPFQVASRMAPAGQWQDLYLPSGAISLFDVSSAYRTEALRIWNPPNPPPDSTTGLTGFVSPPPGALLLIPASGLDSGVAKTVWGLALSIPMALAILAFSVHQQQVDGRAMRRWAAYCAAAALLLAYLGVVGQPTAWLFAAAAASLLPETRGTSIAGGTCLALAIITKASPVVLIPCLWLAGKRRMAVATSALVAVFLLASFPATGWSAWLAFVDSASRLGKVVVLGWPNASVDALIGRMLEPVADSTFREPGLVALLSAWAFRCAVIGFAFRRIVDSSAPQISRVGSAWILWLALSPLLWLHYLVVLIPVFGATNRPFPKDPGLWITLSLSAVLASRVFGGAALWHLQVPSLAWAASVVWVLSRRAWTTAPVSGNPGTA